MWVLVPPEMGKGLDLKGFKEVKEELSRELTFPSGSWIPNGETLAASLAFWLLILWMFVQNRGNV